MKFVLQSPAKINLFLHILGRRKDGYHNIQTVFQFLDFSDYLSFQLDKNIRLQSDTAEIPEKENFIIRVAHKLQQDFAIQQGVHIELKKNIPIGGGLGGGSSNAATTLLALNKLWNLKLTTDDLMGIGKQFGADVPVFIKGHASWAEGIGDELTDIILPEPWYLLVIPPCMIKTSELYNDLRLQRDSNPLKISEFEMGVGHNVFEPLVREQYPAVAYALDWLNQFSPAHLTGTGSVVFARFDTREEASRIATQVATPYKSVVAKGLNKSPLHWGVAKR